MKTVNFIFGIHNHQPVGNFDFVIEDAFQKSYLPFIEVVEDFPSIAISFHFSGCLLEWLEEHHPDYLDRIAKLVKRGNVEIISGGFYEPVLAMIDDRDKIGQIRMMNDYIKKRFNYDTECLWLTERVWEPGLAKPIAEAGIKYITVDDYHFMSTGIPERELNGHFITEEQGKTLSIFPINQKLRYAIPFKDPKETLAYLEKYANENGDNGIVMADDGEKFGVWPGTHETVFKNNWLRDFFEMLSENSSWIKTSTFSDYYKNHAAKGRVYLPTASYFEMSEWTLPWESGEEFHDIIHDFEEKGVFDKMKPFFKGGMWRNFLAKYDESNWMQKKGLYLAEKFRAIDPGKLSKPDQKIYKEALKNLWRGTCNCAYWHGVFGGLYLPHLRHAIYDAQLKCEKSLAKLNKYKAFNVDITDFNADGQDEILITTPEFHLAFLPHMGAIMEEFSLLDKSFNVLNTLRRYKESYHRKVFEADDNKQTEGSIHDLVLCKEEGLDKYLKYDKYPRKSLVDHIIKPTVTLEQFRNNEYYEDSDFIQGKYNYKINKKSKKIIMSRDGWVNWQPFYIQKEVQILKGVIKVNYLLKNKGDAPNRFMFGPEFNFALLGGNTPDRYYLAKDRKLKESFLASIGKETDLQSLTVVNEYDGFKISIVREDFGEFWRFPVETVSLSEAGFERVYQSSVVIPWYQINLNPEEEVKINLLLQTTIK